jgi:hypothetical protein
LVDEGRTGFWLSQNAEIPVLLPDFVPPQHNRIVSPKLEFETLNARNNCFDEVGFLKNAERQGKHWKISGQWIGGYGRHSHRRKRHNR